MFDSGYYFNRKLLITWLRSKPNRGVDLSDIDPMFVPEVILFVGTFLSVVQSVGAYNVNDVGGYGYVVFNIPYVKGKYFVAGIVDLLYGVEAITWIEQFVGRALRVSRMYNVGVSILLPYGVARCAVSLYLSSVEFLSDIEDVEKMIEELGGKWIEYYTRLEGEGNPKLREIYMKRLERVEKLLSDIGLLLKESFSLYILEKHLCLGFLVRDVISRFKEVL